MKTLIFACRLEADSFIEKFEFKQISEHPFEVFKSDDALLYVSGIGPLAAALCANYAVNQGATKILNAGACGDLKCKHELGTVLEVSSIISNEPYCGKSFDLQGGGATLITSSRPVDTDGERAALSTKADVVDMEAYGISSALALNNFDFSNFKAIKFVSDFSQTCDIEANIRANIGCLAPHIATWMDS